MNRLLPILTTTVSLGWVGCGGATSSATPFVNPSPLGAEYAAPHTPPTDSEPAGTREAQTSTDKQEAPLTLETALALALGRNKSLRAVAEEVTISGALIDQAGLYPNPELSIEAEDFGGSGAAAGVSGIQVTTAISQTVELGGKRRTRTAAAELERKAAAWTYEQARISLITEVKKAFIDLMAAERRTADTEDMVRITRDVLDTFNAQMEAGKLTAIEINNAKIALSRANIEDARAQRDVAARRAVLCAFWGREPCAFSRTAGAFATAGVPPTREKLLPLIAQTPIIHTAEALIEKRKADVEMEQAVAVPDVSFDLGYRWFNDPGDSAMVAGAAIPLPFGNRNQGAIKAAEAALVQAQIERDAAQDKLSGALIEKIEALSATWTAAETLQNEVLPLATETLDAIREGNRLGRFGYLDMLKAEETLFQVREDLLGAITQYHHALAELEGIIARPLTLEKNKTASRPAPTDQDNKKDTP